MTYRVEITTPAARLATAVTARSAWHALELVLRQYPAALVGVRSAA